MKKRLRRLLALLLVLLLLPAPHAVSAADAPRLIRVNAEGILEDRFCSVQLLIAGEQAYISLEDAAEIAGLSLNMTPGAQTCSFLGPHLKLSVPLKLIDRMRFEGRDYYMLERLMNCLRVYVAVSPEGSLLFHSPLRNLELLLAELTDILRDESFNANMLEGFDEYMNQLMGFDLPGDWGAWAYGLGNSYDIVKNVRVNALWGGSFRVDIHALLMELMKPNEDKWHLDAADTLLKIHEKLSNASDKLLKAQEKYELGMEYLTGTPVDDLRLLFGIEGSEPVWDSMVTSELFDKFTMTDLFFLGRYNQLRIPEYREALKNEFGVTAPSDIKLLSFPDLLEYCRYMAEIPTMDAVYIEDMYTLLRDGFELDGMGLADKAASLVVIEEADDLVSEFRHQVAGNFGARLSEVVEDLGTKSIETLISGAAKKAIGGTLLLKMRVSLDIITKIYGYAAGMDLEKDIQATRQMFMLAQIQNVFHEKLRLITNGTWDGREIDSIMDLAVLGKSAARLYLKAAWLAAGRYSRGNLGNDGGPTARLQTVIEQKIANLNAMPDIFFAELPTPYSLPVSLLTAREQTPSAAPDVDERFVSSALHDEGSFLYERWDKELRYSYDVPQINPLFNGAAAMNARIIGQYEEFMYVRSGPGARHTLHGEGRSAVFDEVLTTQLQNEFGGAGVMYGMDWEAAQRGDLISVRVNTTHIFNYDWTETRCYCLNTSTGRAAEAAEILSAAGIDEDYFRELARYAIENRCVTAWFNNNPDWFEGYEDEMWDGISNAIHNVNAPERLYERGLFLYEDGSLGINAWIFNGSANGFDTWIILRPDLGPEEEIWHDH